MKYGGKTGRPRKAKTPRQEVSDLILWAEMQGFENVAAALRRVLAAFPDR
jgi:hypothetical protein